MNDLAARAATARRRLAKAERRRAGLPGRVAELRTRLDPELRDARAEWLDREAEQRMDARATRDGLAALHYGHRRGSANCQSCGHFKPEPASVCSWCGDDPVSFNGDRRDFNRAYGRAT